MSTGEVTEAVVGIAYLGSNVYGLRTHTPIWLDRNHPMPLSDRISFFLDEIRKPESWVAGPGIVYDDATTAMQDLTARRQERARRRALQEPLVGHEMSQFRGSE